MARKRAKVKRMTITQQYNRYAIGLRYYGESFETKTRATRKQLKEIKKLSSQIRQQQRAQGITDLPTIAQAYKLVTEQQQTMTDTSFDTIMQQFENIEDTQDIPTIDVGYEYIENFKQKIEEIYHNTLDATNTSMYDTKLAHLVNQYNSTLGGAPYDELSRDYFKILELIENIVLRAGYDEAAQRIASDVELDYTVAITLIEPSDLDMKFEITIQQLTSILERIESNI